MLVMEFPNKFCLTFDVEDFINDRNLEALNHILMLLGEQDQKGLFFITGHMAEKLVHFPQIVQLLEEHEIGYHSTSHSVHPNIFEYTDVDNYQEAYLTSLKREVAHINPLSGKIEGSGGIELLRQIFSHKRIESFRAPGFSWSPPHLEALIHLGFKYDFSANISDTPVNYRGITFFPYPSHIDSVPIQSLLRSIKKKELTVLDFHPNFFVNEEWWDSIFFLKTNPKQISSVAPRTTDHVKNMFRRFDRLLRVIVLLRKLRIIRPLNGVTKSEIDLDLTKLDIPKVYGTIASWPIRRFNYTPRFIHSHLLHFFELAGNNQDLPVHINNERMTKSM